MSKLNDLIQSEVNDVFQRLKDADISTRTITLTAQVGYGDNAPTFTWAIGAYGDTDKVEGAELQAVVTEHMRRKGWTERNKPMVMLTAPAEFT